MKEIIESINEVIKVLKDCSDTIQRASRKANIPTNRCAQDELMSRDCFNAEWILAEYKKIEAGVSKESRRIRECVKDIVEAAAIKATEK